MLSLFIYKLYNIYSCFKYLSIMPTYFFQCEKGADKLCLTILNLFSLTSYIIYFNKITFILSSKKVTSCLRKPQIFAQSSISQSASPQIDWPLCSNGELLMVFHYWVYNHISYSAGIKELQCAVGNNDKCTFER